MLVVQTPQDLKQHIGKTLGPSEWLVVDQAMIDKFAEATGDHQWIHVDVERAKKEMPGGKTIAHGYLTLSLLPRLTPQLIKVEKRKRGINYGSNKIRFTNTVPAGARIRLKQTIKNVEDVEGNGVRITSEMVMEVRTGAPGTGRRDAGHPVRVAPGDGSHGRAEANRHPCRLYPRLRRPRAPSPAGRRGRDRGGP
jgi:acyl dehydratase